jgi:hypothetical protein
VERLGDIYFRLSALDPTNAEYQKKRENYIRQLAEINFLRQLEKDQISNLSRWVTIENFSWSKGGFGSVTMANFSIKNSLPLPV